METLDEPGPRRHLFGKRCSSCAQNWATKICTAEKARQVTDGFVQSDSIPVLRAVDYPEHKQSGLHRKGLHWGNRRPSPSEISVERIKCLMKYLVGVRRAISTLALGAQRNESRNERKKLKVSPREKQEVRFLRPSRTMRELLLTTVVANLSSLIEFIVGLVTLDH